MKMWEFEVRGSGYFPMDMLRYDGCYPATTDDVLRMSDNEKGWRTVRLFMPVSSKDIVPTVGRWRSFGWQVVRSNFRK